jgi:glycine/D-amino acid oxidase-like deaminating enzyme
MNINGPIEQACYWLARRAACAPSPPLAGDHAAEMLIIGAGFTGLWTALFLKELAPATAVTVLEQGVAGYGGSGRNGGILSETIDHSHQLAITHFGVEEAQRLARLGQQNLDEMQQFLADRAIDCEFERTGRLFVALSPAQVAEARKTVAVAGQLGIPNYRLLSAEEVRAELDSPLYLGGVFAPAGGILNPVRLLDGLKREAQRLGVTFHERTRVTGLTVAAGTINVRAATGSVSAGKVILATNAYSHHLFPRLLRHFIPLYDYILVSAPLTDAQRAAIGWRNRQGVTDGRTFFNYYRLTADNRILWGTSEAAYYRGNRVDRSCDHSRSHYLSLQESFARHFPQIADLTFEYAWGGPIASTTRLTPFFGTLEGGRILYGLGYTGHGLGSTRLAGKILAHMALERPSPLLELQMVKRKPFPYPPEPVRCWAVNAVTRSLRRVDAGEKPNLLLRALDRMGIGFSS